MVYVNDDIYGFDLEAALASISAQRREQVLRFRHELGRRQCVLAYLLLKRALREKYGIDENPLFDYGEHGKPVIVNRPEIHFNLSHCREAVCCAVSNHPVGIDVESIREYKTGLVRYTMNDDEVASIMAADRLDVAFTRLWTMKEARLKLTGEGITNNLKTVLDDHRYRYTTTEHIDRGYIYTVCEE